MAGKSFIKLPKKMPTAVGLAVIVVAFMAAAAGAGEAAWNPSPASGATNVGITNHLVWSPGESALSHDVYFGTNQVAVANAHRLAGDLNGDGRDDVLDLSILASQWLTNPGATNPSADIRLSGRVDFSDFSVLATPWQQLPDATFRGNQTGTSYDPATLSSDMTYYWRIDEVAASGTTTGAVWAFTTEPGFPLVISNLSPATNRVSSSSLAVGQLLYTDRTYAFANVASLGGSTFIRTANSDKQSTASSYLTFTVNQDVTVYVAHDDLITSKPSWLSTFTDTTENLTANNGVTYSLYRKDFTSGTVTLGGNAGGVSSSMYSVVVVGRGTVTPPLTPDFYSDTWVAVDALGRALPDHAQCGAPRTNRTVALFYYIWHGQHGTGGPYDVTKLLAANPTNPAWGPAGAFHHWGESELGYYLSSDQWVMRKHAYMMANAGVDVIVFDVTNGYTYEANYKALCDVFMQIRSKGGTTPKICFMANYNADSTVQSLYNQLYSQNLYPELWFYWKGKPLILTPLNGMVDPAGGTINHSSTILNFFNMRYSWTWMNVTSADVWKWMDFYPQQYGWHESSSIPEQISISCGIVPHGNWGRSFHNGIQPPHDQYDLSGTQDRGFCFAEQWSKLSTVSPEFLFITQWNEWVAQRQVFVGDGSDPATALAGDPLNPGDTWFIDEYNQEYSRDIEPMKNGHTDNYYYQMVDGIRRYKGVRQLPVPSSAKTITVDGEFSDWSGVEPTYRDWVGDTAARNAAGWGAAGIYTNTSGRNDFVLAKVARDDSCLYFYIQTDADIKPWTNSNWMMLFINADQDYSSGWQGYDYVVNMAVNSASSTTLKGSGGGWNWTNVNTDIAYRISRNKMELKVPRTDLGQGSGNDRIAFDFKWADNIQATNDIIQFAISGDSAPDRRFNYRYDTAPWTQLSYDDFEAGWGNFADGGTDCTRYNGGVYAHQGNVAANIRDNTLTSVCSYANSMDVSSYSQIKVEFWFYAVSMDPGEDFFVEYYNGSTWQTIASYVSGIHFNNGSFYQVKNTDLVLTKGPLTFPTNARFRFRCDASDDDDNVYIDEVKISAR
jgi:hypothetical protein